MKKGLLVAALFVVVSYAILFFGNSIGGTEAVAGGDATLTGVAEGFGGEISVTVTLKGGKIADVVATGANETDGIGVPALTEIPAKIVEANSTDVDVVSGATYTSNGVIEAVKNALANK